VASIAIGETVGVAPGADLYFIAAWLFDAEMEEWQNQRTYIYYAAAMRRILQINEQLPADRKIRVISISAGWSDHGHGYEQMREVIDDAVNQGLLVISSSVDEAHGVRFHGLGRDPNSDPGTPASYGPGWWWADSFYANGMPNQRLLVPMDSRTTASPTGDDEYVFYAQGGWSWAIPYIAGLYALAVQVDPEITPERFWRIAMETGTTNQAERDGRVRSLGPIVNPTALIESIRQ
jgi:hypothetical protein